MSSMAELRGGLSDSQKEHAKQQRKQLQLDLEQQVENSLPLQVDLGIVHR